MRQGTYNLWTRWFLRSGLMDWCHSFVPWTGAAVIPDVLFAGWSPPAFSPKRALAFAAPGKIGECAPPSFGGPCAEGCGEAEGRRGEGADGGTGAWVCCGVCALMALIIGLVVGEAVIIEFGGQLIPKIQIPAFPVFVKKSSNFCSFITSTVGNSLTKKSNQTSQTNVLAISLTRNFRLHNEKTQLFNLKLILSLISFNSWQCKKKSDSIIHWLFPGWSRTFCLTLTTVRKPWIGSCNWIDS